MLKPQSRSVSDHLGKLVKCDRQPPGRGLLDRQLVAPWTNVLDEGMARDDHPGAAVSLEASHRPQPGLEASVIGLDVVVAYRSVRCHAAGSSSSSTTGYVGTRSDTTSRGARGVQKLGCGRWPAGSVDAGRYCDASFIPLRRLVGCRNSFMQLVGTRGGDHPAGHVGERGLADRRWRPSGL